MSQVSLLQFCLTGRLGYVFLYLKNFRKSFLYDEAVCMESQTCVSASRFAACASNEDSLGNHQISVSHSVATHKLLGSAGGFSPSVGY